jgi:hypothetical protein
VVVSSEFRISDQDRERAARELREHYAAGRLDDDELNERLEAVYAARTERELAETRAELPPLPATLEEQRAELVERRRHLARRVVQQGVGGLGAFVVCTVIWLAAGANGSFWPIWVALLAVVPIVRNGWRLYGPAPELDRVERELARQDRGARRRHRHRGHRL